MNQSLFSLSKIFVFANYTLSYKCLTHKTRENVFFWTNAEAIKTVFAVSCVSQITLQRLAQWSTIAHRKCSCGLPARKNEWEERNAHYFTFSFHFLSAKTCSDFHLCKQPLLLVFLLNLINFKNVSQTDDLELMQVCSFPIVAGMASGCSISCIFLWWTV